jgi:hypothetical protein
MITQSQWPIFLEKFNRVLVKDMGLVVKKIRKKMMMMTGVVWMIIKDLQGGRLVELAELKVEKQRNQMMMMIF